MKLAFRAYPTVAPIVAFGGLGALIAVVAQML
jgi:hypothetical protein